MFTRPELGLPQNSQHQDLDAPIRQTDCDAAVARLSAVQKHYLNDPFVKHLVPRAQFQQPRPPLINIGTYVRTKGIDDLVEQWLTLAEKTGKQCQIVSLGAGSDTRFWRIATGPLKDLVKGYVEIDFPEITTKKAMGIKKSKTLLEILGKADEVKLAKGGAGLHSPKYHLLAADLRKDPADTLQGMLTTSIEGQTTPILSPEYPTLLLFECVLAYMTMEDSSRLLRWFVKYFAEGVGQEMSSQLGCIVYEMFRLNDPFGRVMLNNLQARNISLPGVESLTTLNSLVARFLDVGFCDGHALTLKEIRRSYIEPEELVRISKLEMLDETEELELVLDHYATSWGVSIPNNGNQQIWKDWGLKIGERSEEDDTF